jgi:hypothetical protein
MICSSAGQEQSCVPSRMKTSLYNAQMILVSAQMMSIMLGSISMRHLEMATTLHIDYEVQLW